MADPLQHLVVSRSGRLAVAGGAAGERGSGDQDQRQDARDRAIFERVHLGSSVSVCLPSATRVPPGKHRWIRAGGGTVRDSGRTAEPAVSGDPESRSRNGTALSFRDRSTLSR